MAEKCESCPFMEPIDGEAKLGYCRLMPPKYTAGTGSLVRQIIYVVRSVDWCSHHPANLHMHRERRTE